MVVTRNEEGGGRGGMHVLVMDGWEMMAVDTEGSCSYNRYRKQNQAQNLESRELIQGAWSTAWTAAVEQMY